MDYTIFKPKWCVLVLWFGDWLTLETHPTRQSARDARRYLQKKMLWQLKVEKYKT